MWTHFMDMHSGGSLKEDCQHIFIEAPEAEARVIFYNRFGHASDRVTCTCCGSDYSVSEWDNLAQATGYERGCRTLAYSATPTRDDADRYRADGAHRYYEIDEEPPAGFEFASSRRTRSYKTLDAYLQSGEVLVIRAEDIKPEERQGCVPRQGYVWQ